METHFLENLYVGVKFKDELCLEAESTFLLEKKKSSMDPVVVESLLHYGLPLNEILEKPTYKVLMPKASDFQEVNKDFTVSNILYYGKLRNVMEFLNLDTEQIPFYLKNEFTTEELVTVLRLVDSAMNEEKRDSLVGVKRKVRDFIRM